MKAATRSFTWTAFAGAMFALSLGVSSAASNATEAYMSGLTDKLRQYASTPVKDSGASAIEEYQIRGVDPDSGRKGDIVDLKRQLTRNGKMLDHVAAETQMLSVLVQAMDVAGVADKIYGQDPITIFAPSDEAFAKLAEQDRAELFDPVNAQKLGRIVAQHVVRGKISWSDLAGRTLRLRTVAGTELMINGTDGITVGSAKIKISDVLAANGVIHIIDSVLLTDDGTDANL